MVCSGCGAHLIDGTQKCPFCKEILSVSNGRNLDVTYKIESSKQVELIKNSSKSGISPKKRIEKRRRQRRKRLLGYAILIGILVLLIAVLIGIISLFVNIFSDNTEYTTAYYTDNQLGIFYDDKDIVLTNEAFNLSSIDDDNNFNAKSDETIYKSENGKVTAFLEKFDIKAKQGVLKVMIKDDKDILTVSDKVSKGIRISEDGRHILFIRNANAKGNRGELWYSYKGKKPVKIADKVDSDKFIISQNFEKVFYIKDYNYKLNSGDAYVADFDCFVEKKIDTEVYKVYGTDKKSNVFIYSKDYNSDSETYDLYLSNDVNSVRMVMGCGFSPVVSENAEYVFSYGDRSDDRFNLYRINLKKLKAEKIILNMSKIERVSANGKKVLYSKRFDNSVADYYIWSEGETELKVADGVDYTKENQVAVSEEFEKVAYIANFNEDKKGGLLYYCEYNKNSVSVAQKISEDVYGCYVLNNDKIVYTKNYSTRGKIAQLYLYDGAEREVNAEINPRFLSVYDDKIVCIYDYSSENGGNLYYIDKNFGETKITTDCYGFYIKDNGETLIIRNNDSKTGKFDLYQTKKDEVVLVKKGIDELLFY